MLDPSSERLHQQSSSNSHHHHVKTIMKTRGEGVMSTTRHEIKVNIHSSLVFRLTHFSALTIITFLCVIIRTSIVTSHCTFPSTPGSCLFSPARSSKHFGSLLFYVNVETCALIGPSRLAFDFAHVLNPVSRRDRLGPSFPTSVVLFFGAYWGAGLLSARVRPLPTRTRGTVWIAASLVSLGKTSTFDVVTPRVSMGIASTWEVVTPRRSLGMTSTLEVVTPRVSMGITSAFDVVTPRRSLGITSTLDVVMPLLSLGITSALEVDAPRLSEGTTYTLNVAMPLATEASTARRPSPCWSGTADALRKSAPSAMTLAVLENRIWTRRSYCAQV
ncbi:hypothetical protein PMIN03_013104 [Paraphaeosphaeria minitans]